MSKEAIVSTLEQYAEKLLGQQLDLKFLSNIPNWVYIGLPALYAYYKYATWHFGQFKKLGINGPKPYPIVGTVQSFFTKGILEHDIDMKKKYGNIVGTFQGRTPILMIYDPEILKIIFVKEFANFTNRLAPPLTEYAIRKLLTVLKDDQWRHVRNILTPTFSSGKLRNMNGHLLNSADTLCTNLLIMAEKGETFDFREYCGAFTMDAIASVAFGLEVDSHNDPNNEFVQMGKKAFMFSFASPATIILFFFPFLMKPLSALGISVFPKKPIEFFVNVVQRALEERQKGIEKANLDFLQLMVQAHMNHEGSQNGSGPTKGLSHEEIIAQGLLFFLAGFETTANTLSLLGYSLATNPECQEKLLQEVDEVYKEHGNITYDIVHKMTYLDMCVHETLRRYPAGIRTDRIAAEDITINGLLIPKGQVVAVPIYAIHMDPEVWPEPTTFDPERFSAEQREARHPYSFLAFGAGPRSCIGNRLALSELKIATVTILRKLKFVVAPETEIPLVLDKIATKGMRGIKLRVEKR